MLIGIDEAGRGAWAGPMTAAAVYLINDVPALADSKTLTHAARINLLLTIRRSAYVGIGWVSHWEIDQFGLTEAQHLCMSRALFYLPQNVPILIDGSINYLPEFARVTTLVKADSTEPAVMAASIVAKTMRDAFMVALNKRLPDYGFDMHVGYGTELHRQILQKFGVSDYHRRSFKPIKLLIRAVS